MSKFSLCTYNVHHCYTGGKYNFDGIVEVLLELKPDILCLQEVSMHHVPKLQKALGYKHRLYFVETAVMTNFDVTEFVGTRKMTRNVAGLGNVASSGMKPRHVAAKISLDPDCEPVFVTCCHLHYKAEPTRMAEVAWMEDDLKQLFTDNCCQIWTGDFNSLTREDYDDVTWESIAKIRRENNWESPKTAVAEKMRSLNFTDAWASVGRPGVAGTCRFDTHIDYVFTNKEMDRVWECESVRHVESSASDHKPVIACFSKKE